MTPKSNYILHAHFGFGKEYWEKGETYLDPHNIINKMWLKLKSWENNHNLYCQISPKKKTIEDWSVPKDVPLIKENDTNFSNDEVGA